MPSVGHDLPDFAAIRARDQAELGLAASGLVDPQMFHGRNLLRQGSLSGSGERRLRDGPGDLVVPGGLDSRAPGVGHRHPGRGPQPAGQLAGGPDAVEAARRVARAGRAAIGSQYPSSLSLTLSGILVFG